MRSVPHQATLANVNSLPFYWQWWRLCEPREVEDVVVLAGDEMNAAIAGLNRCEVAVVLGAGVAELEYVLVNTVKLATKKHKTAQETEPLWIFATFGGYHSRLRCHSEFDEQLTNLLAFWFTETMKRFLHEIVADAAQRQRTFQSLDDR